MTYPATGAARTSHFKDISEVRVKFHSNVNVRRDQAEVGYSQPLIANSFPQEFRSEDMDCAPRYEQTILDRHVRISEVDCEQFVVRLRCGTQEQRAFPSDTHVEFRKKTRAFVIHALLAEPMRMNVSVVIE